MFRRVMFGPLDKEENKNAEDLNGREIAYMVPIVAMAIFMGVYPKFFLNRVAPALDQYLNYMADNVTANANEDGAVKTETTDPSWLPDQAKTGESGSTDEK